LKWGLAAGLVLALYATAESRGWATGGRKVAEPVPHEQLRQSSPGSWHYVYWYHGTRGK